MVEPITTERLSEIQEIAEHPSPRQLIETDLIRELVDDREHLRGRLQALSKRWHEDDQSLWHGEDQTEARDGKANGLDDCAEEIDELLKEVFGG